jgi:hypothetical protein
VVAASQNRPQIESRSATYIAGALLAGIKIAAVARQLGVSRSWAKPGGERARNAASYRGVARAAPGTTERVVQPHTGPNQDAFQARKIFVVRGVLLDGGPDHYARIAAAKLFIRSVSSTQITPGTGPRPTGRRRESL